jgi:hypothetical protein
LELQRPQNKDQRSMKTKSLRSRKSNMTKE